VLKGAYFTMNELAGTLVGAIADPVFPLFRPNRTPFAVQAEGSGINSRKQAL
jgi:hypothetical protein